MASMKGGVVLKIRYRPEDIMAAIDIVEKAGIYFPGMSLSAAVRLAVSGLLDAAREAGTVPRRDGYEYESMVKKYSVQQQGRKIAVMHAIEGEEGRRRVMDVQGAIVRVQPTHAPSPDVRPDGLTEDEFDQLIKRKGRILIRLQELQFKQDADPDNFGEGERREMHALSSELDILERKLS